METHDKEERYAQHSNRKNTWPFAGVSATYLIKNNYHVIVTIDMLTTPNFQAFYLEWTKNKLLSEKNRIIIPSIELKDTFIPSLYKELYVFQHSGIYDYVSLLQNLKNIGSLLFITGDDKKAEKVIKASRKSGTYVRVYGLDRDGKLRNYRPIEFDKNTSHVDAFTMPAQIVPIRRVTRKSQNTPKTSDIVYTSDGQPIKIGNEFMSNPQSITYQTDKLGMQAKIYQPQWLTISYFEDKAKRMLEKSIYCEGICWPTDILHNAEGEFVGILVPNAEGYQLKQQLMSQQGLETFFPEWDRKKLTHLAKTILDKIVYLHDRNILFGLVNPGAIFVKDENHVFFAEMDTYQIEGFPILSREKVMQAPELQDSNEEMHLYTKQQDNYEVALLIFMILLPGKFPYNKGKNKNISESVKNMNFAFRYGRQGEEHGAREYFGLWRFVWSHLGNDLKQAFFYTFQNGKAFSTPEKRKDARFWQRKVYELEQELSNPYDAESLKIFPRTFKRFSGSKTITCIKCGIDHPDFYYRYPEKRICNSCLGQPSETHFVCKTCNKSFYYDLGTLFKYEKLIETKQFSMPTHCPYCRSDKRKCKRCGELVPAYRLNDEGLCFDCSKIVRNQITKRYYGKCGHLIELTQGQVDFHMKKFGNLPQRCEQCREKRRNGY